MWPAAVATARPDLKSPIAKSTAAGGIDSSSVCTPNQPQLCTALAVATLRRDYARGAMRRITAVTVPSFFLNSAIGISLCAGFIALMSAIDGGPMNVKIWYDVSAVLSPLQQMH